ncbi:MAG: hypothetical protein NVSMB6_05730 [Burkholderiaceae bacterium]
MRINFIRASLLMHAFCRIITLRKPTIKVLFVLLCAAALGTNAGATQQARPIVIPFSELGYEDDVVLSGPNPKFTVYVPVYPQLRGAHMRVPLQISPLVDKRSTVAVTINERPIYTATVGSMGKNPHLNLPIDIPPGPRTALEIGISGHFFLTGDTCYDLESNNIWMIVKKGSLLSLALAPMVHRPYINDLLHDYAGRIRVVMHDSLAADGKLSVIRLGYYLHQINRWRHVNVSLASTADPSARNIVIGNFPRTLEMRGQDLYANRAGVRILNKQIDDLFVTGAISNGTYDQTAVADSHQRTFDDLGIPTQTLSGVGDLPFMIPLGLSTIGGTPSNLRLHVAMTHTPLVADDRAFLKLFVNNTLTNSFVLQPRGGEEDFEIPIDAELIRSSNDLRIVPAFFSRKAGCKGSYPRMTVSLLNSSKFTWDSLAKDATTVGDFYNMVNGHVVVLVADQTMLQYAFSLLDSLGTGNSAIKTIDVIKYNGEVPKGYDYAILIAPPSKLRGSDPPLVPNGSSFAIVDRSTHKTVYRASHAEPFGILETSQSGTPTLIASYWKDPAVVRGLSGISPAQLAAQRDDIFVFNREQATYSATTANAKPHSPPGNKLRVATVPMLSIFAIFLVLIVTMTARRARSIS